MSHRLSSWIFGGIFLAGILVEVDVVRDLIQQWGKQGPESILRLERHWLASLLMTVGLLGMKSSALSYSAFLHGFFYFPLMVLYPGIGPVFVMICWGVLMDRRQKKAADWDHDAEDFYVSGIGDSTDQRIVAAPTFSGTLSEAFSQSDEEIRRNAVLALNTLSPHESLPMLKRLIRDSDEQVRLYAQSLLTRVTTQLEENLAHLHEQAQNRGYTPPELLYLAEHHFEFVYLDLINKEMQKNYLNKAIELLEKAKELDPGLKKVDLLLLKCALRLGDVMRARGYLEELKQSGYHQGVIGIWEMEIQFMEKNWQEFRRSLDRLSRERLHPTVQSIVGFWS